jgi:hypothetical protein
MIKDLVNSIKPQFSEDVGFDNYIIWTKADATADPLIRDVGDLSIAGTFAGSAQSRASMANYNLLDGEGKKVKMVLLDVALVDGFDPKGSLGALNTDEGNLMTQFMATTNGWASRNDLRPATFRRATYKLNDALRRRYRMD